jgi:hypothetical protein
LSEEVRFMSRNKSDNSQGDTGTRDVTYDLVSTAYHLLQGAETLAMYIADARQEGNQEVLQFLQETKDEYSRRAQRAKELLFKYGRQEARGQSASR